MEKINELIHLPNGYVTVTEKSDFKDRGTAFFFKDKDTHLPIDFNFNNLSGETILVGIQKYKINEVEEVRYSMQMPFRTFGFLCKEIKD